MSRIGMVGVCCLLATICAEPASAATLWIPAQQARHLSATMILGGSSGLPEENALGDFLAPTVTSTADKPASDSFAEFQADIRQAGKYCLWARLRSPLKTNASFALVAVGKWEEGLPLVLGNRDRDRRDWHWESPAAGADDRPGVARPAIELKPGKFTFRITAREAGATVYGPAHWRHAEPALNPHLNLLCLTTDARYVPTDADACRALKLRPSARIVPRCAGDVSPSFCRPMAAGRQAADP